MGPPCCRETGLNANERGYVCVICFLESDGGPEGGGGPFMVQARGVNLAERRSW